MTRRIEAKREVALVPVLEIEPYKYSKLPLRTVVGAREHPREWDDFFDRCMVDARFVGVKPVAPGSTFVVARDLVGNALLDRVVLDAIRDSALVGLPVDEPPTELARGKRVARSRQAGPRS